VASSHQVCVSERGWRTVGARSALSGGLLAIQGQRFEAGVDMGGVVAEGDFLAGQA
jgi:hypothetical protein